MTGHITQPQRCWGLVPFQMNFGQNDIKVDGGSLFGVKIVPAAKADLPALAGEKVSPVDRPGALARASEVNEADRLRGRRPGGAGDAGDGEAELGGHPRERPFGHGPRHFRAHRAVVLDQCGIHAEKLRLGLVGVGDEAALHHVGSAGDFGETSREQASGARLGDDEAEPGPLAGPDRLLRQLEKSLRKHIRGTVIS